MYCLVFGLQIAVVDLKIKKKNTQKRADHIHFKLMLFSSFLTTFF